MTSAPSAAVAGVGLSAGLVSVAAAGLSWCFLSLKTALSLALRLSRAPRAVIHHFVSRPMQSSQDGANVRIPGMVTVVWQLV